MLFSATNQETNQPPFNVKYLYKITTSLKTWDKRKEYDDDDDLPNSGNSNLICHRKTNIEIFL